MSEIIAKEGTLNLLNGVAQYTEPIIFPKDGRVGANSIQLERVGGAAVDVAIVFEVTGDDVFTPNVPFEAIVDTMGGAIDRKLYPVPAVPVAARGRYKLTAAGDTDIKYRSLSQ